MGGFQRLNPSGRTLFLGSTQPLTEMSNRDISWGKDGRCLGLTTLPPSCADSLKILVASNFCSPNDLFSPVQGLIYLYATQGIMLVSTVACRWFLSWCIWIQFKILNFVWVKNTWMSSNLIPRFLIISFLQFLWGKILCIPLFFLSLL